MSLLLLFNSYKGVAYTRTAAEATGTSDSTTRATSTTRPATDASSSTDTASRLVTAARSLAETTAASDLASRSLLAMRVLTEQPAVPLELATRIAALQRAGSDTFDIPLEAADTVETYAVSQGSSTYPVPAVYPVPTRVSGQIYQLSAMPSTATSNTVASVAAMSGGVRQFVPEGSAVTSTVPAAGTAWNSIGWQAASSLIQSGEPGVTRSEIVRVAVAMSCTTAGSVPITLVLYVAGVEIGRGAVTANIGTAMTMVAFNATITGGTAIPAGGQLQMALYGNLPAAGLFGATRTYRVSYTAGGTQVSAVNYSQRITRTGAESPTGTDTAARVATTSRTTSDAASLTDATQRATTALRTGSESTSSLDSATRSAAAARTGTEATGSTEAATRTASAARSASDAALAVEAASRLATVTRSTIEATAANDTISRTQTSTRTLSQSTTATEQVSRTSTASRTGAETTAASELASTTSGGTSRTGAETAGVTESANRTATAARTSSQPLSAPVESITRSTSAPRSTLETSGALDTALRLVTARRSISESTAVTERTWRMVMLQATTSASTSATDSATTGSVYPRTATHYMVPTDPALAGPQKQIAGVVRLGDGQVYLGGATVELVRDSDGLICARTTSSTVDGSYSFARNASDTETYHVQGYATVDDLPEQDVTQRGLVPA